MALQFNKKRGWKVPALTGTAVFLGASYLLLQSFPHLKEHIYDFITGYHEVDPEEDKQMSLDREAEVKKMEEHLKAESKEEEAPIGGSIVDVKSSDAQDVSQWSTESLKAWLKQEEIAIPEDDSHDNLVTIVKSVQEPPSEF